MVVLPVGRFQFGSSVEQAVEAHRRFHATHNTPSSGNSFLNETPEHVVVMDTPIAMGRNEVTREEWAACADEGYCTDEHYARIRFRMPNGPYQDHPRGPILAITFLEMQAYVDWLNGKLGKDVYRLPTEVEWEYSARAGAETVFAEGDVLTRDRANFSIHRRVFEGGKLVWRYDPENARRTLPVDQLDAANAWGIRHMSGNALEATRSCWSNRHLGFESSGRYLAASFRPLGCKRVAKGGFYAAGAELARPERRTPLREDHWSAWLGFRLVRELEGAVPEIQ